MVKENSASPTKQLLIHCDAIINITLLTSLLLTQHSDFTWLLEDVGPVHTMDEKCQSDYLCKDFTKIKEDNNLVNHQKCHLSGNNSSPGLVRSSRDI